MSCIRANSLDEAIVKLSGEGRRIADRKPVSGGDINRAWRLELSDGTALFMKSNTVGRLPFFQAEVLGLEALRGAGTIGVPEPLALGTDARQGISFLLMEYLEPAPRSKAYWETFGRELALLHRAGCASLVPGGRFGFAADNFIGATPQRNSPRESWPVFFRDCRLLPQIELAGDALDRRTRGQLDRLLERLEDLLPEPDFPSLLHGDLWSGNAVCGPDGKAWILDPAAYVGSFEADLAMTELFGGFPAAFYGAYREVTHFGGDYADRRDLYNLYHLLNHLNLFGGSYLYAVQRIAGRYA